jgi:hypothetical protein
LHGETAVPRFLDAKLKIMAHMVSAISRYYLSMVWLKSLQSLVQHAATRGITHTDAGFTAVFNVLRLLMPLKMSYEAAKKRAEPYTKIVEALPQMRRETVQLARQAVREGRHAYVLVNNRCEGNAPMTVQGLSEMLRN